MAACVFTIFSICSIDSDEASVGNGELSRVQKDGTVFLICCSCSQYIPPINCVLSIYLTFFNLPRPAATATAATATA